MKILGVIFITAAVIGFGRCRFTIALINDVHLDLKYDPTVASGKSFCQRGGEKTNTLALYGRRGCDSPFALFWSALERMKLANVSPDLIIVPGDMVTHAIPKEDFDPIAYQELKYVVANHTQSIMSMFPNVPIVFTQGNDDYVINYQVPERKYKGDYYDFMYKKYIIDIPANKMAVIHML